MKPATDLAVSLLGLALFRADEEDIRIAK